MKLLIRMTTQYPQIDLEAVLKQESTRYFQTRLIKDLRKNKDTIEHAILLKNFDLPVVKRVRALLAVLYIIRCNLFHGDKRYGSRADDEVVSKAADVLQSILSIIHGKTSYYPTAQYRSE